MEQKSIKDMSPIEFEQCCLNCLKGYAESENLKDFEIKHDTKIKSNDGTYQIDVYAEFTALGVKHKIICECKKYKNAVNREKVVVLHDKVKSLGAQKGILMSTSSFQSGAIDYAKVHGIALIRVEDYNFEFLSHSSNQTYNPDDPFLYAETHMPPYCAFNCTAETNEEEKVYPTKAMIRQLLTEQTNLLNETMGLNVQLPEL